jgi:hypothetical protein
MEGTKTSASLDDFPGVLFTAHSAIARTPRALHVAPRADPEFVLVSEQTRAVFAFDTPTAVALDARRGVDLIALPAPAGKALVEDRLALNLSGERDG